MSIHKINPIKWSVKITIILFFSFVGSGYTHAQSLKKSLLIRSNQPLDGYTAYVFYKDSGQSLVDSVVLRGKKAKVALAIDSIQQVSIRIGKSSAGFRLNRDIGKETPLYMGEKGEVDIFYKDSLQQVVIGGTPLNDNLQDYLKIKQIYKNRRLDYLIAYRAAINKRDSTELDRLSKVYEGIAEDSKKDEETFFKTHLHSLVALDWLRRNFNISHSKSKINSLYDLLAPEIKNSPEGRSYRSLLDSVQSVEIGNMAPDFKANDLANNELSLKSFRGKYVLLDFWASWCGPCRKENPNLIKVYSKLKDKGFEVLGFSLDNNKDRWKLAVITDKLPWIQLSDLQGPESIVSRLYGIGAIPANFLIDPQGKIVAQNLRGQNLEQELIKYIK